MEHPQELINLLQHGKKQEQFGNAIYKLTTETKRSVESIPSAGPGGYVVNVGRGTACNGMSYSGRNSATQQCRDYYDYAGGLRGWNRSVKVE